MVKKIYSDKGCGLEVIIDSIIGKPAFFLNIENSAPIMETRWDCPVCGRKYGVEFERITSYWGPFIRQNKKQVIKINNVPFKANKTPGMFVKEKNGELIDTGCYRLTLYKYDDTDVVKDADEVEKYRYSYQQSAVRAPSKRGKKKKT